MQVTLGSNAKDVGAAFRELARLFPGQMSQVLNTVGMALRKDVIRSMQGKGPVNVVAQSAATKKYKRIVGTTRTLGGDMASKRFIYYVKRPSLVAVGVSKQRESYFKKFHAGTRHFGARKLDKRTAWGVQYFRSKLFEAAGDMQGARDAIGDYFRAKDGYPTKNPVVQPTVPARPVLSMLAQWPGLSNRIRDAGRKSVERMAAKAAARARRAA